MPREFIRAPRNEGDIREEEEEYVEQQARMVKERGTKGGSFEYKFLRATVIIFFIAVQSPATPEE